MSQESPLQVINTLDFASRACMSSSYYAQNPEHVAEVQTRKLYRTHLQHIRPQKQRETNSWDNIFFCIYISKAYYWEVIENSSPGLGRLSQLSLSNRRTSDGTHSNSGTASEGFDTFNSHFGPLSTSKKSFGKNTEAVKRRCQPEHVLDCLLEAVWHCFLHVSWTLDPDQIVPWTLYIVSVNLKLPLQSSLHYLWGRLLLSQRCFVSACQTGFPSHPAKSQASCFMHESENSTEMTDKTAYCWQRKYPGSNNIVGEGRLKRSVRSMSLRQINMTTIMRFQQFWHGEWVRHSCYS